MRRERSGERDDRIARLEAALRFMSAANEEQLYWHCECGNNEPAQPEYAHWDSEPCCLCENGVARVVTIKEAAAWKQAKALGREWRPYGTKRL